MSKILNGLILSGGASSRMGEDKSQFNYLGKPQHDYLRDLLKPYCNDVFTSRERTAKVSMTVIPDHFELEGPLNGILSAFHFDPEAAWITVPVDMPGIDKKAIEFLLSKRDPQKLATCFLNSEENSPEPLFTIWEPKAKPALFDFFNSGGTSPRKFLSDQDIHCLTPPHPSVLVNINTKSELDEYRVKFAK